MYLFSSSALVLIGCGRIGFDPVSEPTAVGELDPTFGDGGYVIVAGTSSRTVHDLAPRGAGYLAFGTTSPSPNVARMSLVAFTHAGAVDPSFGTNGFVEFAPSGNDFGYSIATSSDRIVLVGDGRVGPNDDDVQVGMLDLAAEPVTSFSPDGWIHFGFGGEDTAKRIRATGDGFVVCGSADYTTATARMMLSKLAFDGSFAFQITDDITPGDFDWCEDVLAVPGGLIAAGSTTAGALVARYTLFQTRDPSFGDGGLLIRTDAAAAKAIAEVGGGEIQVVGTSGQQSWLMRIASDGTERWSGAATFGDDSELWAVARAGSTFVVGGYVRHGAQYNGLVARYLADGTLDPTFGIGGVVEIETGGDEFIEALLVEDGGNIVAAGVVHDGTIDRALLVRLR